MEIDIKPNPPNNLGQTVRSDRRKAGLTQRDLAIAVDCSHTYISKIENGRDIPSADLLTKIATSLGILPGHYLQLAGKENPVMLRKWVEYLLQKVTNLQHQNAALRKLLRQHNIPYIME